MNIVAKERLYLTAAKDFLVSEGHKLAATLYAAIGDEIPESAHEMFGLVDGMLPAVLPADAALAEAERAAEDVARAETERLAAEAKAEADAKAAQEQAAADAAGKDGKPGQDKEQKGGSDKEQKPGQDKAAS